MAMMLAFSALPSELEVLLISVTYGNIDVQNCLRNVISLFHHVEQEIAKPFVAVGPDHPLADQMLMADFFRKPLFNRSDISTFTKAKSADGRDGLGGIHASVCRLIS